MISLFEGIMLSLLVLGTLGITSYLNRIMKKRGFKVNRALNLSLMGVIAILLCIVGGLSAWTLQGIAFALILLYASSQDFTNREADDILWVMILLLAIGNVGRISSVSMLLGGLVIFLPSLLIVMLCRGQVLGGADIKISAACGLMLGFVGGTVGFCIGLLFAIVFNLIYNKVKHKSNKEAFPTITAITGNEVGVKVAYELTIPFEAFGEKIADIGVQNIVFDLNVGALEGTQTLEARINWADHASETRTGNNSVTTTFNVIKVAETSTEIIDMHGEYVEGREVVTSFYVNNEGSSDILPSDHVSFDFRVYKMDGTNEVTVFEQTWNDVVIPATGRNLVYFKWKIPEDSAGTTLFYRGTINAADAGREENADNNTQESSVMVKRQVVSQTPNTRYEDKAPAGYTGNVAAPAHERGKATWNMWVYEGGSLVLKNYGIQVLTGNPIISPSSGCTTAVHEGGNVWTMKSGYGIQLLFSYVMTDIPGFVEPTEAAYTNPQNVSYRLPKVHDLQADLVCPEKPVRTL